MNEQLRLPRVLGWSLLGLLVVASVVSLTASAVVKIPYPQHKVEFYLEMNADGPFLSFGHNDTNGGTNIPKYHLSDLVGSPATTADGALDTVDFFTWGSLGRTPPTATFALTDPLPRTYWLNLSDTIKGQLYWTSTLKEKKVETYGVQYDRALVRVELFQGDVRVGGQDGAPAVGSNGLADIPLGQVLWYRVDYNFRPEVTKLQQGQPLSVRVTPLWRLSDFMIGTHAPQQSHFNLTYFEFDPLEGTAFVSDHNLILGGGLNETGGTMVPPPPVGLTQSSPLAAAVITLPAFGLFALRRRAGRSILVVLLVLLLLGIGLSGCMGPVSSPKSISPPTSSDKPKPVADIGYVYVQALDRQGIGKIQGIVTDERLGLPIRACNILLAGAGQELLTDDTGTYEFAELQAGDKYHLYFEASEYDEFDTPVTVKRGYVAYVNVSLVSRIIGTDEGDHQHNPWGASTSIKLTEDGASYTPDSTANVEVPSVGWWCSVPADENGCRSTIPFPPNAPVPAGAVRLEIKLKWDASATGARELALRAYPSSISQEHMAWTYVPRPSEVPFNVVFFPNQADASHQTFTNWKLEVFAHPKMYLASTWTASLDLRSPMLLTGGPIEYEITAYKGVLPYEPGHKKFWKNETKIELYHEKMADSGLGNSGSTPHAVRDYPYYDCATSNPRSACWILADSCEASPAKCLFVPPGSREITGTFSWEPKQGAAPPHEWKLKFKPSNAPKYSHDLHDVEVTTDNSAEGSINFRIPLQGTEPETNQKREDWTDSVYLSKSNWVFYVDDGEPPIQGTQYGTSGATGVKWFLTLTVYKDPIYEETPPAPSA